MKTKIYCKTTSKGVHSFYLLTESAELFLFNQPYRRGVADYFTKAIVLDEAINYSRAHEDAALMRTMTKIPMYVKYVEKEYGIEVLNRTKKQALSRKNKRIA